MSESPEVKAMLDKWYSLSKKERREYDYSFRRYVSAQSGGLLQHKVIGYGRKAVKMAPTERMLKTDVDVYPIHSEEPLMVIQPEVEVVAESQPDDIQISNGLRENILVEVVDIPEQIEPIQQIEWNPVQRKAIERRERSERMRLELIAKRGKTEYKKTPEQYLQALRSRAEKKGIDFDLTPDWIEAKMAYEFCEATGVRFRGKGNDPFGRTIDRKDSSKGYTKANCWVACWMYNTAKMDNTHEDVMEMVASMWAMNVKAA